MGPAGFRGGFRGGSGGSGPDPVWVQGGSGGSAGFRAGSCENIATLSHFAAKAPLGRADPGVTLESGKFLVQILHKGTPANVKGLGGVQNQGNQG